MLSITGFKITSHCSNPKINGSKSKQDSSTVQIMLRKLVKTFKENNNESLALHHCQSFSQEWVIFFFFIFNNPTTVVNSYLKNSFRNSNEEEWKITYMEMKDMESPSDNNGSFGGHFTLQLQQAVCWS